MNQAQNIRLPGPVYTQLKALAAARATTMVEVVASFLSMAVEAGEIAPDTSGLSARLHIDLDAPEGSQGPYVIVCTPAGDMPPMTREDAIVVAAYLVSEYRGADVLDQVRMNRAGEWRLKRRGTSATLIGRTHEGGAPIAFTMAPVVARGLSDQIKRLAVSAVSEG